MSCFVLAGGAEGAVRLVSFSEVVWEADPKRGRKGPGSIRIRGFPSQKEQKGTGRQEQIMELYDALCLSLYGYLRSMGLSADEAEDTVQESFLRLAVHLKEGGNDDNLRSWLFQVAHNLSMDIHRASRRVGSMGDVDSEMTDEPVDQGLNPELMYLQKERVKHLEAAMSQLTPRQRGSILLWAEGLRYGEIALVLGVSEQRVIHLVKRGLMRLAVEL